MLLKLARNWAARVKRRAPDEVIGVDYLLRWHVIPRNPWFNVYLHEFHGDDDRTPHDHPWESLSFMIDGELIEYKYIGFDISDEVKIRRDRILPGALRFRSAKCCHRLETRGVSTTLFITGPRRRSWGFETALGWVHWRDFTGRAVD